MNDDVKKLLEDAYTMFMCPFYLELGRDCTRCESVSFCDLSKWLKEYERLVPVPESLEQNSKPNLDAVFVELLKIPDNKSGDFNEK